MASSIYSSVSFHYSSALPFTTNMQKLAVEGISSDEHQGKTREIKVKESPQAVIDWYMIALDKKTALKKSVVKEDALGHLLWRGWEFFYIQKKNKQELRYKAPNGKVYISLRTACKAYIDQDQGHHSLAQKKEIVAEDHSEPVMKSSDHEIVAEDQPEPVMKSSDHSLTHNKEIVAEDQSEPVMKSSVQNFGNEKLQPLKAAKVGSTSRRNPRTGLSYLMDHGLVSPGDRVYYDSAKKGGPFTFWGSISKKGEIKCDCCSNPFAMSKFEAHIGSTKHRPAANIFLEDGRSLLDCQKQLNQSKYQIQNDTAKKVNNNSNAHSDTSCLDKNDCICSVCHFGGDLILCDLCPAAFHGSCLGLNGIPSGDWYCLSCCCKICGQVTYDFDDQVSSFDKSFVKCVQCEQNVHIGCVKSIQVLEDDSNQTIDRENWFCTRRCEDIHMGLQKLLWKPIPVGKKKENLTWTLMKYCPDNMTEYQRKKLNIAVGVMHKSFRPVKDPITKNDLIEDVVLSRRSESKRLNFEGFYTVALESKNIMTTVATVRVYGDEVAEVPLVATQLRYRRQGMCRKLMNQLENQLIELGVKRLTLPAVPEALNTWTNGFGFSQMTDSDRLELIEYTFLGFQHTVVCQKDLLEKVRISNKLKWWPRKKMKQSCLDYEFSDNMCLDDWNSIAEAF